VTVIASWQISQSAHLMKVHSHVIDLESIRSMHGYQVSICFPVLSCHRDKHVYG
jgi:hypothetical protein